MAMRCDEIREQLVELLYNERGTSPASAELQAHVDSCPSCRLELAELQAARNWLQVWKDEPPLRSLAFPVPPGRVALRCDGRSMPPWLPCCSWAFSLSPTPRSPGTKRASHFVRAFSPFRHPGSIPRATTQKRRCAT